MLRVMKQIPDGSIDCIKTDLPFGTTNCKWDVVIPFDLLWEQYHRIIKDNGAILLNAQTPFDKLLGASNIKNLRYEWIWEKTNATGHLNAKKMPMKAHENVLVFYKKPPVYNPQMTHGHERKVSKAEHKMGSKQSDVYQKTLTLTTYDSTDRYPRSVLKFPSDKQKIKLNPTQKPLALEMYFVSTYTNPGDTVLDSACGSGTLGQACKLLGRNAILIDNRLSQVGDARRRIQYSDI